MPKRIQRSRKKGWKKPDNAVIVDRTSRWGNPFTVKDCVDVGYFREGDKKANLFVVNAFEYWLHGDREHWMGKESDAAADRINSEIESLRGKDLICFCPLDMPCHADVLLHFANR